MATPHPAAPEHLLRFIPGPDGSDPLFTVVVVLVIILFMAVGVLYFRLHSLPEQMAEGGNNTQILLISVLAILALLTHNNSFWILALLLAVIKIPDFLTPLRKIAGSLEALASFVKTDQNVGVANARTSSASTSNHVADTTATAPSTSKNRGN